MIQEESKDRWFGLDLCSVVDPQIAAAHGWRRCPLQHLDQLFVELVRLDPPCATVLDLFCQVDDL